MLELSQGFCVLQRTFLGCNLTTRALIFCAADSPANEVAILTQSDGSPPMIGRALAEVCAKIIHGATVHPVMLKSDPDLNYRLCRDGGLSAMILGLLHAAWDEVFEEVISIGGDEVTLRNRYSHDQFYLLPASAADQAVAHYVYRLAFRGHPPHGPFCNPKRVWITLEGRNGFEGWPEQFRDWLELNWPEKK